MIVFLDKSILLYFYQDKIKCYGGSLGIRDETLFWIFDGSGRSKFGGENVLEDIFHMAAAYGFHICNNYPFVDGNKRTVLIAMYLFLFRNGCKINVSEKVFYALVMDLASGKVGKDELREFLKNSTVEFYWFINIELTPKKIVIFSLRPSKLYEIADYLAENYFLE